MRDNIITTKVSFNGVRSVYKLTIRCIVCGNEAEVGNVFPAKYCLECRKKVIKDQTRIRQQRWRDRKKLRENGHE